MKYLVFLILLLACACQSFKDQPVKTTSVAEEGSSRFLDTTLFLNLPLKSVRGVRAFYAKKNFSLSWHEGNKRIPAADSLIVAIRDISSSGLIPGDYHLRDITNIFRDTISSARMSHADILLTDAFLTLHHHLRHGRLDQGTLQRKDTIETDPAAIRSLESLPALSVHSELQLAAPLAPQYHLLKNALQTPMLSSSNDSSSVEGAIRIALNMERWRWQKSWPDRYVVVNIPSFMMHVVEHDSVILESSVIVGKRETPTPVLESVIRSFIIYPYWHAPYSIATKEILPAIQADTAYLKRNNFDVLNKQGRLIRHDTIQWRRYSSQHFPFVLRQREGSENSMGIIKFNFTNKYGVYLHDTNSKRLFARRQRDLSHGCVRVNRAIDFAHYLVREDDVYVSPEDLDQYLSLQQRLTVDLRMPITLKLEYFTAEVRNGVLLLHDDIYKKDSVMMRSLFHSSDSLPSVLTATPF